MVRDISQNIVYSVENGEDIYQNIVYSVEN